MSMTKICPGCGYPYKLGSPYMGEMCDTGGKCLEDDEAGELPTTEKE